MDRIRPWLYFGKYRETLNRRLLAVNQIEAMLQLAELVEHPLVALLVIVAGSSRTRAFTHDQFRWGQELAVCQRLLLKFASQHFGRLVAHGIGWKINGGQRGGNKLGQ